MNQESKTTTTAHAAKVRMRIDEFSFSIEGDGDELRKQLADGFRKLADVIAPKASSEAADSNP